MCGRYLLSSPIDIVRRAFRVDDPPPNLAPRWNIAPTTPCLVVRRDESGRRRFAMLRWGLVPAWARDISGASRMINARGETVAEKPAYRDALRKRRCLVPADGFYEWPEQGEDRRPVLFRQADGAPMAFAGLWESWRGGDGAVLETFTIVNTEARAALRAYHHRVPIVLSAPAQEAWLDPSRDPMEIVTAAPFEDFAATRVSARVNSVRNDDPGCIEPAGPLPPTTPAPTTTARKPGDPRQSTLF
ncbi:MAG: SOS response-associated peptidase [Alphaproteobacteria bacterium]|nr:SOS response-associated peptidase [Alphaproteobacteria bacterium]